MQLNQHTITILQQQYYDVAGNHVGTNDLPALRCCSQNTTIIFISSIAYSTKVNLTTQKMKFPIKYFFSKCDQICRKLHIWSYLPKKSQMDSFNFCVVSPVNPQFKLFIV